VIYNFFRESTDVKRRKALNRIFNQKHKILSGIQGCISNAFICFFKLTNSFFAISKKQKDGAIDKIITK
jgi:hypothetical protein